MTTSLRKNLCLISIKFTITIILPESSLLLIYLSDLGSGIEKVILRKKEWSFNIVYDQDSHALVLEILRGT